MTAHVIYEKIDTKFPATLSAHFLQTVLRGQLGFEGLIFSDDLSMQGVCGYEQVAAKALAAGCDMVLICHNRRLLEATLDELSTSDIERYGARLAKRIAWAQPLVESGLSEKDVAGLRKQLKTLQ